MNAKKKRATRIMWFTVALVQVIDKSTGELSHQCKALVARDGITRRAMKTRGYRVGDELRADVKKARDFQQWKTAHGLALLCIEQIDRFSEFGDDCHACLKSIQLESGIACETRHIDASGVVAGVLAAAETVIGKIAMFALRRILPAIKTIPITEAKSLSYDTMDAGEFQEVFDAMCRHVLKTYWPQLDPEAGQAKIMQWIGEQP